MKNSRKKVIAIVTLASIVLASFAGCSGKGDSAASLTDAQTKTPFQYGFNDSDSSNDDPYNLNEQDPTDEDSSGSGETVSEYEPVTDDNGEPVTTYVVVTDSNGEEVTDTDGSKVTTAETVTTVVTKDDNSSSSYKPHTKRAYALWLDISKGDEGYYFEDSFIKVTFKVKDDIPDGAYDVKIADPDFSSIKGQVVTPDEVYHGKVFVNTDAEKQVDYSSETGLVVAGDYVSAKQGDEITFCFNIKNNPGLAAMCFWFEYDENAMELINCEADGEFAEIANSTETGTGKSQQ